jgi:hypothetical protein
LKRFCWCDAKTITGGASQFCNEPKNNCMPVNGQLLIVNGKAIRSMTKFSIFDTPRSEETGILK